MIRAIAGLGCASVILAAPSAATAETTCTYLPAGKFLDVSLSSDGDLARLDVGVDGTITVFRMFGPVPCAGGTPTVTNTAVIDIGGTGAANNSVAIRGPSRFAPGPDLQDGSDNVGGTSEIEIHVSLHDQPGGNLVIEDPVPAVPIRFGFSGVNPNATSGEVQPDADIFPTGVRSITAFGSPSADIIGAQGGAGTGPALPGPIDLIGSDGNDELTGGAGDDFLAGEAHNNKLSGMGGNDRIRLAPDHDIVDGGAGTDQVEFGGEGGSPSSVSVDLAIAGIQNTFGSGLDSFAGVENVTGTPFPDVLRGNSGSNKLIGFEGGDILDGRGAADTLQGGEGADSLGVRDGAPDIADCGPQSDTVTADSAGTDTLVACESPLFPAPVPSPAGTASGRDLTRPGMSRYGLSRRTFAAASRGRSVASARRKARGKAGTTVRYRLSEPAKMRFTVEGLRRGRYRRLRGSFSHSGRRGANRFKFTGRLRGRKLKPGRYRLVATATDAARNRSKAKRVKFRIASR